MENPKLFASKTHLGKNQFKKIQQLVQALLQNPDSYEFRVPVDYLTYGLPDYPIIVKRPMDLGTVKNLLQTNYYQSVEDCLTDVQLIWDNCKLYNLPESWIYKLAIRLEKLFKKMIKNYVPFVIFEKNCEVKKQPIEVKTSKASKPQLIPQEPKDYFSLKNQSEKKDEQMIEQKMDEGKCSIKRKHFLQMVNYCSQEQVGVMYLLMEKHCPQAIDYEQDGSVNVRMEDVPDELLEKLLAQFNVWGVQGQLADMKQ